MSDRLYDAMSATMLHGELATTLEWRKWIEEIPYIQWPQTWQVKAIPPFSCAIVRYLVRRDDTPLNGYVSTPNSSVSVYLDCYGILGSMGQPYWEVYPGDEEGDTARCLMGETDDLLGLIEAGLQYLANRE